MGDWYLGEIRAFPYVIIPEGWLACNGAILQIQQYAALNSLLGTTYGGDGRTTFALPDLRGRTGVGRGTNKQGTTSYKMGQAGGLESVALTQTQIPAHTHNVMGIAAQGAVSGIKANYISSCGATGTMTPQNLYAAPANAAGMVPLNPGSILADGGGAGHENMQPFLVLNLCIAYQGVYPTRPN